MGAIMRLVSAACVTAITQGRWYPKPIAEAILALQASSFAAGLAAPDPAPLDVELRDAVQAHIDWLYRQPGARRFTLTDLRAAIAREYAKE